MAIEIVENVEPPNAKINAKTAIVYITYKNLAKAQIGESVDHKAIVRRVINEPTGHLAIQGHYWIGDGIYASTW